MEEKVIGILAAVIGVPLFLGSGYGIYRMYKSAGSHTHGTSAGGSRRTRRARRANNGTRRA